jgi:hypothetical protein
MLKKIVLRNFFGKTKVAFVCCDSQRKKKEETKKLQKSTLGILFFLQRSSDDGKQKINKMFISNQKKKDK